jgi:hypothetical protein
MTGVEAKISLGFPSGGALFRNDVMFEMHYEASIHRRFGVLSNSREEQITISYNVFFLVATKLP